MRSTILKLDGEPPFNKKPFPQGTPDIGEYGADMELPLLFSLTIGGSDVPSRGPRERRTPSWVLFFWYTIPLGFLT